MSYCTSLRHCGSFTEMNKDYNKVMNQREKESSPGGIREMEGKADQRLVDRTGPFLHSASQPTYPYGEVGLSYYACDLESSQVASVEGHVSTPDLTHSPMIRARGPGRPRMHPPKPAGISRPRGRPKGSKNKTPKKKLERPPKRPRGRPRKWPPEMWEGFQRTHEAVIQHQLHEKDRKDKIYHHLQQEMPGPSHFYLDQAEEATREVQHIPDSFSRHHTSQTSSIYHHSHYQHHHQEQAQFSNYMQMSFETERPQEINLMLPPPHNNIVSPVVSRGGEEYPQEQIAAADELLWIQRIPPEDLSLTNTTS